MDVNKPNKVVILGDASVGKTCILHQIYKNHFRPDTECTIGASYIEQYVETSKYSIRLHILDTGGHEGFRNLIPIYLKRAVAAIIVVDVTSYSNINSLDIWYDIVKQNCLQKACKVYIVANKIDLLSESEK